jgi:hypothetical protein
MQLVFGGLPPFQAAALPAVDRRAEALCFAARQAFQAAGEKSLRPVATPRRGVQAPLETLEQGSAPEGQVL